MAASRSLPRIRERTAIRRSGARRRPSFHPLGRDAKMVGEVVAEEAGMVRMQIQVGGVRISDAIFGEQLRRICLLQTILFPPQQAQNKSARN